MRNQCDSKEIKKTSMKFQRNQSELMTFPKKPREIYERSGKFSPRVD